MDLKRLGIAAGCFLHASALLAQAPAGVPDPAGVRAALLVLGTELVDEVWPGHSGPKEFVLCTKEGGTLLALNDPPTSAGAQELEVQSGSTARLYYMAERPASLSRCIRPLGWEVNGRRVLAFPQLDSVYSLKDPLLAPAAVLIHEEFHLYQLRHFSPTAGGDGFSALEEPPSVPRGVVESADFQRLAQDERQLLARALRSSRSRETVEILRLYLALRLERMALVPRDLRSGEAHIERKEGSAHYVATAWASGESGGALPPVGEMIARDLEGTRDFRFHPEAYRHAHIYFTGAAIALLLDRLDVEWQRQVRMGATFKDLLQEVLAR